MILKDFVDNAWTRHLDIHGCRCIRRYLTFTLGELPGIFRAGKGKEGKPFKRPDVLSYMADLQAHLLETGLIGKASSVADVIRKVNQELTDGRPESFAIPPKVPECFRMLPAIPAEPQAQ